MFPLAQSSEATPVVGLLCCHRKLIVYANAGTRPATTSSSRPETLSHFFRIFRASDNSTEPAGSAI